jgi:DNA helicase-2/ATP-dependent DNA helicase PcrA
LLEYIDEHFLESKPTEDEERTFDPLSALRATAKRPHIDVALLRALFSERGLSATALNNYLNSPWEYVYKNMLRIPEVQPLYLLKGTALHGVLESVTSYNTEHGKLPKDSEVKRYLERELGRLPITSEEYVRLHEEGFEILLTYIRQAGRALPKRTREEMRIEVVLQTGNSNLPLVKLTGMLDRLDFDEGGNVVRVIDYKSGKPKTRGYIEGKTKNSNGDYKRQLVFYALLLSLYDDERFQCREGVLSFVEADAKGKIHEESYSITDDEVEELKREIIRVALEIASGAFLNTPCDPAKSEYCALVRELFGT